MKLCRYQPLWIGKQPTRQLDIRPESRYGIIEGQEIIEIDEPFVRREPTGRVCPLEQARLLPPSTPTKVVCVGRNYAEHAAELGNPVPKEPLIFLKPPSAVIGPDEPIVLPKISSRVDYEGEIAIVIAKKLYQPVQDEDLRPYTLGYTALNDVSARDIQKADVQFTRGKGFDTFCPIGPLIETDADPSSLSLETYVNGKRKQSGHASGMIFSFDVIIRWISAVMTLEPGDVIATGTPPGVGPLVAGDVVEVMVSGVGTLRNPVAAPESG